MVEQVKAWQRMGDGHRAGWYNFVLERGGTRDFDPKRHDESTLSEFLSLANSGQIDLTREAPEGARSSRGKGGWGGGWGDTSSSYPKEFSVKLGNLPAEGRQTETHVREYLSAQGVTSMTDIFVPNGKVYGFVRFSSMEDAQFCMKACQGLELQGQAVTVEFAESEKRKSFEKRGGGDMMSMMNMMSMMMKGQGDWGKGWGKGKGKWSAPY